MRRNLKSYFLILTLILTNGRPTFGQAKYYTFDHTDPAPKVILFSLDGIGFDQFNSKMMPKLWKIANESGGWGLSIPSNPAMTFPSHISVATGVYPEKHGVVSNSFFDRSTNETVKSSAFIEYLNAEPLWVASTRYGIRTAVYHWPCATGSWRGVAPEIYKVFDKKISDSENLDRCSEGLSQGIQFIMAYLSGTDSEGHFFGALSPQVLSKLKSTDDLLSDWILSTRRKYPNLKVIMTSDHGMASPSIKINLYRLLKDFEIQAFAFGGSAFIYSKDDQLPIIVDLLNKIPGLRAWKRSEIPEKFRLRNNPRTGDIFVIADLPNWLSDSKNEVDAISEIIGRKGAHSYITSTDISPSEAHKNADLEASTSMASFFVFIGKPVGNLGTFQSVDIAPTIAEWLSLKWESARDGVPISRLR
jgi:predicted AlkP superfamily pyrophosphatase or phosphodiesterase